MIYFAIYPPATKHPDEWTIYKLRLNKCLHKDSLLLKLINLDNLTHTASFLPAFLHREITWSSKLRILPISIPSTFCFALFQLFSYPILTQTFSYLCPKTKRWHLSLLSFMLLISNHSFTEKGPCFNLLIRLFRSLSKAWNVVSSARLQTSVKSER